MPCPSCAERRKMLADAAHKARSGDIAAAARIVGQAAVHLATHDPIRQAIAEARQRIVRR